MLCYLTDSETEQAANLKVFELKVTLQSPEIYALNLST